MFLHRARKEKKEYNLPEIYSIWENGIIVNFTNDSFLLYSYIKKELRLVKFEEKNKNIFKMYNFYHSNIKFPKKIASLSFSDDHKKIYACLAESLSIVVIDYDEENREMNVSGEEIKYNAKGHFKKCIYLGNNSLASITNYFLFLWNKIENTKKYLPICKEFNDKMYDICSINDKYLVLTFPHIDKLSFYNLETLEEEKIIEKIDCMNEMDHLIKIEEFILVNCRKGIAIVSIKTKEIVQYVQNWDSWIEKSIIKSFNNEIYIFSSESGLAFKFIFIENGLNFIEEITIMKSYFSTKKYGATVCDEFISHKTNAIVNKDNIIMRCTGISILTYG